MEMDPIRMMASVITLVFVRMMDLDTLVKL